MEGQSETLNVQAVEGQQSQTQPGITQTTGVNWAAIPVADIPADVVKQHPLYREVLGESIERRQKLKELSDKAGETPAKAEKAEAPADAANQDMPAWAKALALRLDALGQQLESTTKLSTQQLREAAVKSANLPAGAERYITGNTPEEMNKSAAELAAFFNVTNTSPGAGSPVNPADGIIANLEKRFEGTVDPLKNSSIFDPGIQQQKSGGSIR